MSLGKSMHKYKRYLGLLAIIVLVYHLYKSSFMQEGYSSSTQCSNYSKCSDCVKNFDGDSTSPCWWSNDKDTHGNVKGCSAFKDQGFSRTCTQPDPPPGPPTPIPPFGPPTPIPPGPIIIPPGPGPGPNTCNKATNCQSCLSSDCFWGDTEQKCSSTFKAGYVKICSGNNPNPNPDPSCPKCETCPNLTLLKTPTFITTQ